MNTFDLCSLQTNQIAGHVCKWISPKFVFGYTILVSLVRFFCGPLKGRTPFRIHFRGECCQNYKLRFVAKFFVRFVDLNFVQCFSGSVLVVWFLKSLVRKKNQIWENSSFRYFNSVGDVYFGDSFLQQRLFSQALTLAVDRHFKLPVYFCF